MRAAAGVGVVAGADHHDRQGRVLRAQVHQHREAAGPGHGQVEQQQVGVGVRLRECEHAFGIVGLLHRDVGPEAADEASKRIAEQRVVVGDEEEWHGREA